MDEVFSNGSYEEGQSQTREYQKLLREFLREDLSALIERGDLDQEIIQRIDTLSREGRLGPEFVRAVRARESKSRSARATGRDSRARSPWYTAAKIVMALILLSAALFSGWYIGRGGARGGGPLGVEDVVGSGGTGDQESSSSMSPQPPTLVAVLAQLDAMLTEEPEEFRALSARLQDSMLDGALQRWRGGTASPSDRDRVRRAMAQVIVSDDYRPLNAFDGEYGADCSGESCPAIREYWEILTDTLPEDRRGRFPSFPGEIPTDSMPPRLEDFEKALIADYLGLWEAPSGR